MNIELNIIEIRALKIIAIARSGGLKQFDCDTCDKHEERNCKCDDRETVVYYHPEIGELTACPLKYIPHNIWSFIDEYDYTERYKSTAKPYEKCNPRYWAAVKHFEIAISEVAFCKKDSSTSNFSAVESLKKRFIKR